MQNLIHAISEKMIFNTHKIFQGAAADRKDATIGVIMISRVRNVCKIMKWKHACVLPKDILATVVLNTKRFLF